MYESMILIKHPKLISTIEDGKSNVQINFEPRKENPKRSYSASSSNSFFIIIYKYFSFYIRILILSLHFIFLYFQKI